VIVGLGADLTEVERIRSMIERRGEPILRRLFTPAEIAYCEQHRNKYERYAGRFAVKEAAMKALGTGWRRGVRWVDIEITREASGKPALELRGVAREFADRLGVKTMAITITHTEGLALAQVIFEN
jgi:holo-[acyl-carrier protein] synthase